MAVPAPYATRHIARFVLIGAVVLLIGGLAGFWIGRASTPRIRLGDTASFAADEARNADLLLLKSEAEALTIAGKLEEAHAKYRQMTGLATGREFKGPLLWDILERAKVDQDRIYWILLARMEGADRAFGLDKPPLPNLPDASAMPSRVRPSGRALTSPSVAQSAPIPPAPAPLVAEVAVATSSPVTRPASAPAPQVGDSGPAATLPVPGTERVKARVGDVVLEPVPFELTADNPAVLDDAVDKALRSGAGYLLSHVKNGELPVEDEALEMHRRGLHALVVYALLTSGQAVSDTRLRAGDPTMGLMLARLKSYSMEPQAKGPVRPVVYARSLRAAALSVLNRPEDRLALKSDVQWLLDAHVNGGFSYDDKIKKWKRGPGRNPDALPATQPNPRRPAEPPRPLPGPASTKRGSGDLPFCWPLAHLQAGPLLDESGQPIQLVDGGNHDPRSGRGVGTMPPIIPRIVPRPKVVVPRVETLPPGVGVDGMPMWDNSNSQYAVLGIASGAAAGVQVPAAFWKDVRRHWFDSQHQDGQWSYRSNDDIGSLAMTAGGTASLLTVNELLQEPGSRAFPKELELSLRWLEEGANAITIPGRKTHYIGYDLFGVGRVGLLSGYKYFGAHDWYRSLAGLSVSLQNSDGSWGRSQGPQADRVVDTAFHMLFLARGRHPIMMNKLSWSGQWNRRPRDAANAARYLSNVAERPMNWQVVKLERPGTEWLDAPILYIASDEPPLFTDPDYDNVRQYVQSGGMLFLHADDASHRFGQWAQELCRKITPNYQLVDVPADHEIYSVLYKLPADRKRLQMISNGSRVLVLISPYDLGGVLQTGDTRKDESAFQLLANIWAFANGRTNPRPRLDVYDIPPPRQAPLATIEVARLKYSGNWNPEPGSWSRLSRYLQWEAGAAAATKEIELSALTPGAAVLAHLTGTTGFEPTDAELQAIRAYVEAGGSLLIDACGGSDAFARTVDQRIFPAFAGLVMKDTPADQAPIAATSDVSDDLRVRGLRPFVTERRGLQVGKLQVGSFGKGRIIYSPLDLSTGMAGSKAWGVAGYTPDYSIGVVKNVLLWAATAQ